MLRSILFACASSVLVGLVAGIAAADVASDRAAAILIFPRILALRQFQLIGNDSISTNVDTVVQISNTSNQPARLHCFYVSAVGHCSLSGVACGSIDDDILCQSFEESCIPGWTETDFDVFLTPRQPLAWRASVGLSDDLLPLGGTSVDGNAGTRVPPVGLQQGARRLPFDDRSFWEGELKCVVVDDTRHGIARNVVKGEGTVIENIEFSSDTIDTNLPRVEKYNAIGIEAIAGDSNRDGVLELGGPANEYNGCPNVLIAEHAFDFGSSPQRGRVASELTLVPCTQDLRAQAPGSTTAQFLVFNEFEQRFSTSRRVDCYFKRQLSHIDTLNEERSIFSDGVAGTLQGQTRIRGVGPGLVGVLTERFVDSPRFAGDATRQLGLQGTRPAADTITLP